MRNRLSALTSTRSVISSRNGVRPAGISIRTRNAANRPWIVGGPSSTASNATWNLSSKNPRIAACPTLAPSPTGSSCVASSVKAPTQPSMSCASSAAT